MKDNTTNPAMKNKITSAEYQHLPIQLKNRYTRYPGINDVHYELMRAAPIPEAQPLEGVKTADDIINEIEPTGQAPSGSVYSNHKVREIAKRFKAQFATEAVNQLGQKEFDELDRINKAIAKDAGELLQAAENSPSMLRPNYYDNGERAAYKAGAEFGANWKAKQAPSTHSSSEMVEVEKLERLILESSLNTANPYVLIERIKALANESKI